VRHISAPSMRHTSALAATTLAVAGLVLGGCGSSSSTSSGKTEANGYAATSTSTSKSAASTGAGGATGGGTVVSTEHTSLGTILVAGPKRLTVYLFAADTGSSPTCTGACAQAWPAVTTSASPKAQGGAMAADLGTTTGAGGTMQVTYRGHPLYYYISDQQSGETTGQGVNSFGAPWYVLSASGSEIR
jgi:predicted lipoprotein with Yx(FWY)xxD motif